jgi:hypothetical protein
MRNRLQEVGGGEEADEEERIVADVEAVTCHDCFGGGADPGENNSYDYEKRDLP